MKHLHSVHRSVTDHHGETDILVIFESEDGKTCASLVENKISAPPQPEQAARYMLRAKNGQASGMWSTFSTCIVAPERYLSNSRNTQGYDARVSYESIRDWLRTKSNDQRRGEYRASAVEEGIQQNRRGYSPEYDDHVSNFWQRYWLLSRIEFAELNLSDPGSRPKGSCWMQFKDAPLPGGCRLQHKADRGLVQLELIGKAHHIEHFMHIHQDHIPLDTEIILAGKSLALSQTVPPLDHFASFDDQEAAVREGLQAASRLLRIATSELGTLLLS